MARFVAKAAAYTHGAIQGHAQFIDFKGDIQPAVRRVDANFKWQLVNDQDFLLGATALVHTGLPMTEDTEQDVSPRSRMSVWDSEWAAQNEGLRPDEIEAVILALRNSPEYGKDFVEVMADKTAKPWPTYDELEDAEDIAKLVNFLGLEPANVIKYELENQNRESVLEALQNVNIEAGEAVVIDAS